MSSADDARSGYTRRRFLSALSIATRASESLLLSRNFDNKGNRIAFGTPTTDYGFMEGEYFAGRRG